jgi:uncharacterized membrane-anchored protein YitT (DUF2179 family)
MINRIMGSIVIRMQNDARPASFIVKISQVNCSTITFTGSYGTFAYIRTRNANTTHSCVILKHPTNLNTTSILIKSHRVVTRETFDGYTRQRNNLLMFQVWNFEEYKLTRIDRACFIILKYIYITFPKLLVGRRHIVAWKVSEGPAGWSLY